MIFSPSAPKKLFDTLTMLDSTASSHSTLSTSITTLVTHSTLPDHARIQPKPMLDAPAQPKLEVPASFLITTLMATYPDLPDSGSLQPNSVLEAPAQTTLYGTGTSQPVPDYRVRYRYSAPDNSKFLISLDLPSITPMLDVPASPMLDVPARQLPTLDAPAHLAHIICSNSPPL